MIKSLSVHDAKSFSMSSYNMQAAPLIPVELVSTYIGGERGSVSKKSIRSSSSMSPDEDFSAISLMTSERDRIRAGKRIGVLTFAACCKSSNDRFQVFKWLL